MLAQLSVCRGDGDSAQRGWMLKHIGAATLWRHGWRPIYDLVARKQIAERRFANLLIGLKALNKRNRYEIVASVGFALPLSGYFIESQSVKCQCIDRFGFIAHLRFWLSVISMGLNLRDFQTLMKINTVLWHLFCLSCVVFFGSFFCFWITINEQKLSSIRWQNWQILWIRII